MRRSESLFFYARQAARGSPIHSEALISLTKKVFDQPFIVDRTTSGHPRGVAILVEERYDPVFLGSNCWANHPQRLEIPLALWGHMLQWLWWGIPKLLPVFAFDPDSSDMAMFNRLQIDKMTESRWTLRGQRFSAEETSRVWPEGEVCVLETQVHRVRSEAFLPASFLDQAKKRLRAEW